jgi:3',5'-cyclic-AMP phosphodiesterase
MNFEKKHFFYLGAILFLVVLAFGVGILIVQKKTSNAKLSSTSKVTIDLSKEKTAGTTVLENSAENKIEESPQPVEEKKEETSTNQEASQEENKFTFGIIGDTQYFKAGNSSGGFQKAVKLLTSKNIDLAMAIGDIISSCDADCGSKLAAWKNVMGGLYPKTYPMMGNHDRTGREKSDAAWQNFFNLPTNGPAGFSELAYSFDFKNSHFVVLDSDKPNENIVNDVQRAWLEQDLNANKKDNTFVFFHEPAYPVSSKIGESLDVKPKERDALWSILSSHNVTAVFSGHEHIVSRKKIGSLYQFIFGNTDSFNHEAPKPGMAEYSYVGQSLGIVEVNGKQVTVNTYSVDGKLLNSFPLVK